MKTSESECNEVLLVFPIIHGFLPQIHSNQKLVLHGEQLVLDSFHCVIFVLIVMFCLPIKFNTIDRVFASHNFRSTIRSG